PTFPPSPLPNTRTSKSTSPDVKLYDHLALRVSWIGRMSDRRKVKVRVAVAESGGTPLAGTVLAKSQIAPVPAAPFSALAIAGIPNCELSLTTRTFSGARKVTFEVFLDR